MTIELHVLRLVHVLGAIFWVGAATFNAFFLMPVIAGAGPAAGPIMAGLQRRRMMTVLPIVAVLTILSGIRLMQITSSNFSAAYFASARGATYGWAGVIAIVSFLVGMLIVRPAMVRAGQLAASLPNAPEGERATIGAEINRLRKRGGAGSTLVTWGLLVAAAGMAVARYL